MKFSVVPFEKYILVLTFGEAEVGKFADLLNEVFGHSAWHEGMGLIVDHSSLDVNGLSTKDIQQIALNTKAIRAKSGAIRSATIAPEDIAFGLSRMWLSLMADDLENSTLICRNLDEAVDRVS